MLCLNQPSIEMTSNNLLYLAHILNRTIHEVTQSIGKPIVNDLPELDIPDFIENVSLLRESSQPIYDLEKIIALHKNNYRDTLYGRVTENSSYLSGLSGFLNHELYCGCHNSLCSNRPILNCVYMV